MKFLDRLRIQSTAAGNVTVNETKDPYLGRLQRGMFFVSTFVVSLLNQDFIFLGLEEEEKEMGSCKMTTTH